MVRLFVAFVLLVLASGVHAQERTLITRDNLTQVATIATFSASDDVTTIAFSPNEQLIAAGDEDGGVTVWDIGTGNEVARWNDADGEITALAWHTNERVVAGSDDGFMQVYDIGASEYIDKVPLTNGEAPQGLVMSGALGVTGGDAMTLWAFDDVMLFEFGSINPFGSANSLVIAGEKIVFADSINGAVYSFSYHRGMLQRLSLAQTVTCLCLLRVSMSALSQTNFIQARTSPKPTPIMIPRQTKLPLSLRRTW